MGAEAGARRWHAGAVRAWTVGSGLVEADGRLLLVANRRRDGRIDWTPPGGVIDEGEDVLAGLTREVAEETGITVTAWEGPVYRVEAEHAEAGWSMRVEVHRATSWSGELRVGDDPDGIVVDARFVPVSECDAVLAETWQLITEPVGAWLTERFVDDRLYRYRVDGADRASLTVTRL